MDDHDLPLIVDIKRGSLHDGPGIRSVVFFKGCPLRCSFCHSPETQNPNAEISFSARRCLRCGRCVAACPEQAITLQSALRIDRDKCTGCGRCATACPEGALRSIGQPYRIDTLVEILLRDLPYYRHSHGGITLSGGECTLYPDYLEALLRILKARGIHVVLETCGYFHFEVFAQKILPYLDLIYYDVKIADPQAHQRCTGQPNQKILENLRRLLALKAVAVYPRVPLVPGLTATRENLSALVDLLIAAGADSVSLLPYNPLGTDMAGCLGRAPPACPREHMRPEEEEEIRSMFQAILEDRRVHHESRTGGSRV
jgi:pyruvate formate lyase activating enzyme